MLILFTWLFLLLQQACYGLIYNQNQRYSYSGKHVINVLYSMYKARTDDWNQKPFAATIPYPTSFAFNNQTNLTATVTFGDLQYRGFHTRIIVKTILVLIISGLAKYLSKISICYLLVMKEKFVDEYRNFIFQYDNNQKGYNFSNTSLPTAFVLSSTMNVFNFTGGATSAGFISGINVEMYSDSGIMQLLLQTEVKSPTLFIIKISSPSRSVYLQNIIMTIIVYNKGFSSSQYFPFRINSGIIKFQDPNQISFTYTNKQLQMLSFNTFVGLSGFKISYQNTFSFSTSFDSPHSLLINSSNYFDYLTFGFIVITSANCNYKQPYFQETSKMCYSKCQDMTPDIPTLSCLCYLNNKLTNNPNCTTLAKRYSTIIVFVIGSVALLCLVLVLFICIKRRIGLSQDMREFSNEVDNPPQSSQNSVVLQQMVQVSYSNRQERSSHIDRWIDAEPLNEDQQTCRICKEDKAFFKNHCSHSFHLSCIINLQIDQRTCPDCNEDIRSEGQFYCTLCRKKYVILEVSQEIVDRSRSQLHCNECQNIQL